MWFVHLLRKHEICCNAKYSRLKQLYTVEMLWVLRPNVNLRNLFGTNCFFQSDVLIVFLNKSSLSLPTRLFSLNLNVFHLRISLVLVGPQNWEHSFPMQRQRTRWCVVQGGRFHVVENSQGERCHARHCWHTVVHGTIFFSRGDGFMPCDSSRLWRYFVVLNILTTHGGRAHSLLFPENCGRFGDFPQASSLVVISIQHENNHIVETNDWWHG